MINSLEWKKKEKNEKNAFSIPKRSTNDEISYLLKKNLSYFSFSFLVDRYQNNWLKWHEIWEEGGKMIAHLIVSTAITHLQLK